MQVVIAGGVVAALVVAAGWVIRRALADRVDSYGGLVALAVRWVRQRVLLLTQQFGPARIGRLVARKDGLKLVALGVGLFVAGVGLTNLPYVLASGRYLVPSALFVAGVFALGVGMSRMLTGR